MSSLFKKTARTRTAFFFFFDVVFIFLSVYLSFLIRFDGYIADYYYSAVVKMAILIVLIVAPIFYLQRLYHFSWAYVGADELVSLFKAMTISFILLVAVSHIYRDASIFNNFPRSTILISYFLVILFCGAIRFAKRFYFHAFNSGSKKQGEKTLIVGAGDAGEQMLRSVLSSAGSYYSIRGFIDDNPIKWGITIHGFKVLGKIDDIPKIVKESAIDGLIIALPSAGTAAIKRAVELGRKSGLQKIKVIPSLSEIIDGRVSIKDLREIQPEDLLGREPVFLDTAVLERFINKKRVLITGAAGSIGSELSRQVAKFKPSLLLLLDQDETGLFNISEELSDRFNGLETESLLADILEEEKINYVFHKFKPNIVFHAAAYKHVSLMERDPAEAVRNNIFGTKTVAEASLKSGADEFVFISTDKAVNPSSVMGATKRAGEMICQVLNKNNKTKFVSVRFGNVLNSRGSVIPIFKEQIKRGGPVEVTHPDMKRYFMLTSEACLLVMQAATMGRGGEVFVLDMGKPVRILDLAKEMIKAVGFEPDKDIPIVFTGSKPGEKLFEEILTAEEGTIATQNQKIFRANLSDISAEFLEKELEKLKGLPAGLENNKIIEILQSVVSSYQRS